MKMALFNFTIRWAAGVIAISWILHVRMTRMKKQLKSIRRMQAESFRTRAKVSYLCSLLSTHITLEIYLDTCLRMEKDMYISQGCNSHTFPRLPRICEIWCSLF